MGISRTSSGTILRTNFPGTSIPAWLTEYNGGSSYWTIADNKAVLTIPSAGIVDFLVLTDAMPSDAKIARVKYKVDNNGGGADYVCFAGVSDRGTRPASTMTHYGDSSFNRPTCLGFSDPASYGDYCTWGGAPHIYDLWGGNKWAYGTEYVIEFDFETPNTVYGRRRVAADMSVYPGTGVAKSPASYSSNKWLYFGSIASDSAKCIWTYYYVHLFKSNSVAITGLATGNAVRLYDAADDSILVSAVESGGTASLDCSSVDWDGLTCYLAVFQDDTYTVLISTSEDITDAAGGDEYEYTAVAGVNDVDPLTTANLGTCHATITGANYTAGITTVWLEKSGEVDIPGTTVTVNSPTELECDFDVDEVNIGTWRVAVSNGPGLTSTWSFQITDGSPVIDSILPALPYVADPITISGHNFGASQGASTVTINGLAVTSITSWSDTKIICTVPSGATAGTVVVTIE